MEKPINIPYQQSLRELFAPFIDEIVDRVAERVLQATKEKDKRYYTREETADLLHVTLPTLWRMTKDGFISSQKAGGRILYDSDVIDKAIREKVVFKYKHR